MITPSLLEKVRPNIKDRFNKFALFEMNQVFDREYIKFHKNPEGGSVPVVENALGLTLVIDEKDAFYVAKRYADEMFARLGVEVAYKPVKVTNSWTVPFEEKRSADIRDAKTDKILGIVGEYRSAVRKSLKLPSGTAGFEININNLAPIVSEVVNIPRDSSFPDAERDVTFKVDAGVEYAKLESLIKNSLERENLKFEVVPVSIYQGIDKKIKNISFRLVFASYEKTLEASEIDRIVARITKRARAELKAEVV